MANKGEYSRFAQEFWHFAVALYAKRNIRKQLLLWQDCNGANVNIALLCIWAGARGRNLSSADIRKAEAAVSGWHAGVTQPLRGLRRRLKLDWRHLAGDAEPAREAVIGAELEAERAEQSLAIAALAPWPATESGDNGALIRANLHAYLGGAATAAPASIMADICASV